MARLFEQLGMAVLEHERHGKEITIYLSPEFYCKMMDTPYEEVPGCLHELSSNGTFMGWTVYVARPAFNPHDTPVPDIVIHS